jgi:long-chain acyl-CoA synthetase
MTLNLGSLLAESAIRNPHQTAIISDSSRLCYQDLDESVRRCAHALESAGFKRGDRLAIMLPNIPEFTIIYFAALYRGCVLVTLNTLLSPDEVAFQLANSEAKGLVVDLEFLAAGREGVSRTESCQLLYVTGMAGVAPEGATSFDELLAGREHSDMVQTMPDETAVIIYTSGTTGHPKGAELTHFNLYRNAQYVSERAFSDWPETIQVMGPGQVALSALPLYHIFGQTNVQNAMLLGGATFTNVRRFTPEAVIETISRDQVTFFPGVPTMYFAVLHAPESESADMSSLQFCVSGGAAMPVEVKRAFEDRFKVHIQEGYGLTETSPLATIQSPSETAKAGTIGKPIDGIELRIFDDQGVELPQGERGEIVMRGHNTMKGYFRNPQATEEAFRGGWFHSGDIGYIDEEGDVFIVDRKKDLIIRGGYNVYPREVEEVLYAHKAIREAAVLGVPDEKYGEEVRAVISLKKGCEVTPEEIISYCKNHLAAYKYPRVVDIIDELPKGSTGKILKRAMRE